jgi:NAD-dependent deacetylase
MEMDSDSLDGARAAIAAAHRIAVLTGAGISAESGIPTFRDAPTGLWSKFRPEDLATPQAFLADPKLVWDWYAWRRGKVAEVAPNAGHRALAELQRRTQLTLITQNVDGLHQQAGSEGVIELHGNIRRVKCFDHGHPAERWEEGGAVPRCAQCGSLLRPDVVWFGELLPDAAIAPAMAAAADCDLFLSVGTSGVVEPAASLPVMAKQGGAFVIEVNPQSTPLSALADLSIRGAAGVVLPQLV